MAVNMFNSRLPTAIQYGRSDTVVMIKAIMTIAVTMIMEDIGWWFNGE